MSDIDLSKPTLEGLAYLLRHKELWPQGFKWDYDYEEQCAIELTNLMWNNYMYINDIHIRTSHMFGLTPDQFNKIFNNAHREFRVPLRVDVTPEMVADLIDRELEEIREAKLLAECYQF